MSKRPNMYIVKHYKAKSRKDVGRNVGGLWFDEVEKMALVEAKNDKKCIGFSIYTETLNGKRHLSGTMFDYLNKEERK